MKGHIVTKPLPAFGTDLGAAKAYAARLRAEDAVPPRDPIFVEMRWGPEAILASGAVYAAKYVSGPDGLTRVVVDTTYGF